MRPTRSRPAALFTLASAALLMQCRQRTAFETACLPGVDCVDNPTVVANDDGKGNLARPSCGDGVLDPGEQCDDGPLNDDSNACTRACKANVCGDGILLVGSEGCDDGNAITEACAYGQQSCVVCTASCNIGPGLSSYCGDAVTDTAHGEACDGGATPSLACAYGQLSCRVCDGNCQWQAGSLSYCGDGVVQSGEECDAASFVPPACAYGAQSCQVCNWACKSVPGATSSCGDGVVSAPDETCDSAGPGCVQCQVQPGWTCNPSCVQRVYRVALIDTVTSVPVGPSGPSGATATSGALHVRDFSSSGAPIVKLDVLRGANVQSLKPSWSWDGNLVAYPVSDFPNQTYLYEGAGPAAATGSFIGTEPSFASPALQVLARQADGYVVFDDVTGVATPGSIAGAKVREPEFEAGSTTRFAYLDAASGATTNLMFDTGSLSLLVDSHVQSYAWKPEGGQLAYVAGASGCNVMTADVQVSSIDAPVLVASNVACGALLAYAPSGPELAVAAATKIYALDLTGAPYDLSAGAGLLYTSTGAVSDLGFTPDNQFLAYLAAVTGPTGHLYLLPNGATGAIDTGVSCACSRMAISPAVVFP